MLQMFHLQVFHLFQIYVANVSSRCFKSRPGVAYIAIAIYTCFKCFICFRRILQVFHLDVSKIDLEKAHVLLVRRHGSLRAPAVYAGT
jgi:hypothetical protein